MQTSVTDYLIECGISFQVRVHSKPALTCETAAAERGVRVSQIVKCMVGKTEENQLIVMLIPGDRKLKSSKARKWLQTKSLELVAPADLVRNHKLVIGAISPIDLIGKARILMDPSVLAEEVVDISSGDPLGGVELRSKDLRDILEASMVEIISNN